MSAEPAEGVRIALGHSTAPLNGPWRFHVGDGPRWSSPDFDDSAWETVDLTPAPGAHDDDVGLPGYVSGWSRRGHAGYTGFAWYRIKVAVDSDEGIPLALAGPTLVDSAYQLYVDGKLLGGSGGFTGTVPTVYGVRPSVFPLSSAPSAGTSTYVIAFRVWMDPMYAGADSGGIHVAPTLGHADGIALLHQAQWLKTFTGYVADAVEPFAFVVLALMVVALMACRTGDAYRWLAAALIILALLRVKQALFFWTDWLSLGWVAAIVIVLTPLSLAAWTLAWRDWFRLDRPAWLGRAVGVLAVVYVVFVCVRQPWFMAGAPHGLKAVAHGVTASVRLAYAALYLWIIGRGLRRSPKPSTCLAALAAVLVGIGLFATEVSALGIPGIWFPYGVGVARGQYAYAAFIAVLFVLILQRSIGYARRG
ncbi:hypothetical protein [Mizugakiibacter sediminis]|uniref:hypothetical protein n=1 Tax=Mizugakiibacter sediminis TaxID=1475481 RepID=UPI00078177A7|nr:hypothetical protein [Mizugakiibacter sediminis]